MNRRPANILPTLLIFTLALPLSHCGHKEPEVAVTKQAESPGLEQPIPVPKKPAVFRGKPGIPTPSARVISLRGTVMLSPWNVDTKVSPSVGQPLFAGTAVSTGEDGSTAVQINRLGRITLSKESRLLLMDRTSCGATLESGRAVLARTPGNDTDDNCFLHANGKTFSPGDASITVDAE